ncbi:peptide deformylase [Candidatus Poribacteria bacterium]|nr:peptide deformylase [Candidatus Poribacteria bacterium]
MTSSKIMKYGSKVLREVAQPVESITDEIKQIVDNMLEVMYKSDGVGLAAPQIGISKRIAVIDISPHEPSAKAIVLINPEILELEGQNEAEEGCLSVPDIRGIIKRSERIVVKALDLNGQEIRIEADGLLARAIQHELDHLNGKFFVDHLGRLKQQLIRKQLRKIESEVKENRQ